MPDNIGAVVCGILLVVVLIIAVPLRNKIREDQAIQRKKDEEAERIREEQRRLWAEEDALLDAEEYEYETEEKE